MITSLSKLTDQIDEAVDALDEALEKLSDNENIIKSSEVIRDDIIPKMETLRGFVDAAQMQTAAKFWPYPGYGKLLFSVK